MGTPMKPLPPRPDLMALVERAKSHVMTPDERAEQRRSFVIGNVALSRPDLTKEEIADAYNRANVRTYEDKLRTLAFNMLATDDLVRDLFPHGAAIVWRWEDDTQAQEGHVTGYGEGCVYVLQRGKAKNRWVPYSAILNAAKSV